MEATIHRSGEGETIGGATTVTLKATGEETNGSFYLGETLIQPGRSAAASAQAAARHVLRARRHADDARG